MICPVSNLLTKLKHACMLELQRRVLPFLAELFPRVRFIVTTHSPHVVTSLKNAVVFDLECESRIGFLPVGGLAMAAYVRARQASPLPHAIFRTIIANS